MLRRDANGDANEPIVSRDWFTSLTSPPAVGFPWPRFSSTGSSALASTFLKDVDVAANTERDLCHLISIQGSFQAKTAGGWRENVKTR